MVYKDIIVRIPELNEKESKYICHITSLEGKEFYTYEVTDIHTGDKNAKTQIENMSSIEYTNITGKVK